MGRDRSNGPRRYLQLIRRHPYQSIGVCLFAVAAIIAGLTLGRGEATIANADNASAREEAPLQPEPLYRLIDGKPVGLQDLAETRTVGVMIENLPETRPQSGLGSAPVVYESLVEGGATRFLALFPINDVALDRIGPVRSIRPYYLDWLVEYEGVLAHAGGSPEALSKIYANNIPTLNAIAGDGKYFWRDRGIAAPHNLFTSSDNLKNALTDTKRKTKQFTPWHFKDDAALESRPSSEPYVRVKFSGYAFESEFRYRKETNVYARFNAGRPHEDAKTGEQIQAKNVIVQVIPPIVRIGEKGRLTLDVDGEGRAFIFVDGVNHVGTWKKADRTSRTEFFFADGSPAQLNRGNTWVEIVPEDRVVEAGDLVPPVMP